MATLICKTDEYVDFSTKTQSAKQGRLTIPKGYCLEYAVWSPNPVRLRIESRGVVLDQVVKLTSGNEVWAKLDSELYHVLPPGEEVIVRFYRPTTVEA